MQDPDGDGIYEFSTDQIPAGSYQAKVAIDESCAESYGAGGGPDNIPFDVAEGATVHFFFDSDTNIPDIVVGAAPRYMGLQSRAERQLGRELRTGRRSGRSGHPARSRRRD